MIKLKSKLRKIAIKAGLPIYSATRHWNNDKVFQEVCDRTKEDAVKGIPEDRCFTLYKAAIASAVLEGDLAECGCRQGKSSRFILAGMGSNSQKTLHIFDSFEGLSPPNENDKLTSGKSYWKQNALATPKEMLLKNLQKFEQNVSIYKGWIPDRFQEIADKKISMVHIDVDLYEPTLESLKFFYPRMVPRGIIICDDYASASCPGARKAFDEFFMDKPELLVELPMAQILVYKV